MRVVLIVLLLLVTAWLVFAVFGMDRDAETPVTYSRFMEELEAGRIVDVTIRELEVRGRLREPVRVARKGETISTDRVMTILPFEMADLPATLREKAGNGNMIVVRVEDKPLDLRAILARWLPVLLLAAAFLVFYIRRER